MLPMMMTKLPVSDAVVLQLNEEGEEDEEGGPIQWMHQ
jgi:hypothetical protein